MTNASTSHLDLRETTNHPLSLRYSELYNSAILNGKFDNGRVQPCLRAGVDTPFVMAAQKAVDYGIQRIGALEVMIASLADYYSTVLPRNASEWLGLSSDANPQLLAAPPWAAVFPWRARSLESYREAYENAAYAENLAQGRDIGIADGWLFCGPVSEEKIKIEAERILCVLKSISKDGYHRHEGGDGDVRATALINDDQEWVWLITAGNHRAAAAAALGYESIPVRVNLVISRNDALLWKHVVDGLFTMHEAVTVFDNIFYGRSLADVRPWFTSTTNKDRNDDLEK
jgi:hypothetical protein